ncbi:MAG: PhoPQ-activated pathogenicity-related family protein [Pirellulaceae bacterium]|nr:PhoPQ-activated pathogenicity-related family protein [Pirellulaceae bacterium]
MKIRWRLNDLIKHLAMAGLVLALPTLAIAQQATALTDLDRYVHKPDPSFRWKVASKTSEDGVNQVVLDVVSQNWLTSEEVNRTEWQHWIVMNYPDQVKSNVGFMMIGGGNNTNKAPTSSDGRVSALAKATGSVVFELKNIPNQPLVFHNDGQSRVEDDLIGYTWDQFIKGGRSEWTARNAMVKGAVRAMDAVSEFMASEEGGRQKVDQFVVSGGSKRGWTTWLTGAVDSRVVGIAPIVIDVVNADKSMRHHFAAYGFWAPAVGNYVQHNVMQRMGHPRLKELYDMEDPFSYRERLTMPKFVINAAGDQFFLPDSSQFYWDELKGPKAVRYIPNADHGLGGTDVGESLLAFHWLIVNQRPLPDFQWNLTKAGIRVQANDRPVALKIWQATNPEARDFRMETLGKKFTSQSLELDTNGAGLAVVPTPEKGWTAYFVEATYDVGAPTPLKLTSGVQVIPDLLPFADKDPALPPTVTVVAEASEKISAEGIQAAIESMKAAGQLPNPENVKVLVKGSRCYINWTGNPHKLPTELGRLALILRGQGCNTMNFQVESGDLITLPPVE